MNEQEYISNPNYCPVCNSDDFRVDDSHYDNQYHWVYLRCAMCDSQWTEEYILGKMWVTTHNEFPQDLDNDNNNN